MIHGSVLLTPGPTLFTPDPIPVTSDPILMTPDPSQVNSGSSFPFSHPLTPFW